MMHTELSNAILPRQEFKYKKMLNTISLNKGIGIRSEKEIRLKKRQV